MCFSTLPMKSSSVGVLDQLFKFGRLGDASRDDDACTTVFQQEGAAGKTVGVKLEKRLMNVAGETLKINMTAASWQP